MIPLIVSLAVLSPPRVQSELGDALTGLASTMPCCEDKTVTPRFGKLPAWMWDSKNDKWTIGHVRGYAKGASQDPPTGEIVVLPDEHGYDSDKDLSDQPEFMAEMSRTLAHECLHFCCPPHAPPGVDMPPPPPNPDNPPQGDGRDPDCNDINYAIHTAAFLCAQLQNICQNGGPVPGVPGTDTPAGLCAYCEALKETYGKMQGRWNTEDNAEKAAECASSGWDPEDEEGEGDDFSNCPDFPPPPGPPEDPYPDNKVIPDCDCECPCDN
ncbi:MAG: hypothetical protein AB1793_09600 [Candidatus Thermoplasmatota archaeon]